MLVVIAVESSARYGALYTLQQCLKVPVDLRDENIHCVIRIKLNQLFQESMIISQSFTYNIAAKTGWRRYGTKLRHCQPVHIFKQIPICHL